MRVTQLVYTTLPLGPIWADPLMMVLYNIKSCRYMYLNNREYAYFVGQDSFKFHDKSIGKKNLNGLSEESKL